MLKANSSTPRGGNAMTKKKDDQQGFIMKDAPEETAKEDAAQAEDYIPLPEMNFSTFVVSLNASALMHLGLMGRSHPG